MATSFAKMGLLSLVLTLAAQPAGAEPSTPLGKWFCTSLKNFDAATVFSTFPLQKLGKPEEKRKKNNDRIAVRVRAESLDLAVEYSYQYKESDVDRRYGFELEVVDKEGNVLDERTAMRWLMEFGKPERKMTGWHVATNKQDLVPSFAFGMDDSPYVSVSASWFSDKDIARAGPVCDAAKAPPANASLPNALDQGPAVDPKKDPLSLWFCSVLKKGFDFPGAAAKFPLEPLTIEAEQRETDDDVVTISRKARSDNYAVEYRYSYQNRDVNDPYGFGLFVSYEGLGPAGYEDGMKWLRGFGAPKKDLVGYSVAAVPPEADGFSTPFVFAFWTTGMRSAQWFSESDIALAGKLCPH